MVVSSEKILSREEKADVAEGVRQEEANPKDRTRQQRHVKKVAICSEVGYSINERDNARGQGRKAKRGFPV